MPDMKVAVPLTFVLALSAVGPNAGSAAVGDPADLLKPGSLRTLLESSGAGAANQGASGRDVRTKMQIAQPYGCIYGYWRRC